VARGARLQAARPAPGGDGVALFGGVVAVVAHGAGGVDAAAWRRRRTAPACAPGCGHRLPTRRRRGCARRARPGDAAPAQQAPDKGGVGFVVLHRLFARRIQAGVEQRIEFVLEGAGQHRVRVAPLVEQHLHDIQFVLVAEDAAVDALFHDRQRVAQHQLVGGEAAVAVAGTRFGDDAADAAQLAAVGDDLDFGGQRDEASLSGSAGSLGDARDAVVDAAAHRLRCPR
jgi:hypothetical protein